MQWHSSEWNNGVREELIFLYTMNVQANLKPRRKQNPAAVKQNIVEVAIKEFVANGLAGSSVNVIAENTDTFKRMSDDYFVGNRPKITTSRRNVAGWRLFSFLSDY